MTLAYKFMTRDGVHITVLATYTGVNWNLPVSNCTTGGFPQTTERDEESR